MPTSLRWHAIGLAALAAVFLLFFFASKHDPSWARVNPFAEDPYDAVGSFSFQFVLLMAALSLLRAFRPYPAGVSLHRQARVVACGLLAGLLAVVITCLVDVIAMGRHSEMWMGSSAGYRLAVAVLGIFLWATLSAALLVRTIPSVGRTSHGWRASVVILLFCVSVAAWYPETARKNFYGELFTVLVGAVILFVPLRFLVKAFIGTGDGPRFDLLDDLASLWNAVESRTPSLRRFFDLVSRNFTPAAKWIASQLRNRRAYPSLLVALTGLVIGTFLVSQEMNGDGPVPLGKIVTVAAVYIGLETTAIALGYALLSGPLALFAASRQEPG